MIDRAAIDAVLAGAVAAGAVPGVVALAADRSGEIYRGAFGRRDLASDAPMAPDTVFWIASMTKAITSVMAMQLVEEGKLALDAPLGPLLPWLAKVQVLEGFDAAGQPRLRAPKRPITLRHLLTHTAGFSYNTWNPDIGRFMEVTGLPATRSGKLLSLQAPLVRDPGEAWEYSIATDWVGQAVEAAGGERIEVAVRQRIAEPLGMADTGYIAGAGPHPPAQDGRGDGPQPDRAAGVSGHAHGPAEAIPGFRSLPRHPEALGARFSDQ